jgi:hypothetical protein
MTALGADLRGSLFQGSPSAALIAATPVAEAAGAKCS